MSFEKPDLWKVCEDGGWAVLNSHGETESDHLHIGDAEMIVEWHNRAVLAEAKLKNAVARVERLEVAFRRIMNIYLETEQLLMDAEDRLAKPMEAEEQ